MSRQLQLINQYWDYIGTSKEYITAIENDEEVVFMINYSKTQLINLKPKIEINEIKIFFNGCRIIFKKII